MNTQAESDFIWSCARKKRYKKREWATNILEMGQKNGYYSSNCHVYHCNYCDGWHIGHRSLLKTAAKPVVVDAVKKPINIKKYEGVTAFVDDKYTYINVDEKTLYKKLNKGWQLCDLHGKRMLRRETRRYERGKID